MRQKDIITINAPLILKMRILLFNAGFWMETGEIVEGEIEEGGCM
jgi:hypothetical protein